ncbi:MAG: NAD(P)/FAD-dependent oxidoreductase [Pirellulaceae bacterium]
MSDGHAVVMGGGVIGVATAYYLARRGGRVTLVEQDDELCTGSSHGNAGQVTPGHLPLPQPGTLGRNLRWLLNPRSPLYVAPRLDFTLLRWLWRFNRACNETHLRMATEVLCRLGAASSDLFDDLARELDVGYQNPGRLEVCRGERSLRSARKEAEMLHDFGFEYQLLRGTEVSDFEPAIQDEVAGAVYFPVSGYCNPQKFVLQLAEAARAQGATIRTGVTVTDLRVENGRLQRIATSEGEIEADAAVVACGSWTPQLMRSLGITLPVQPGKGYHLDVDRPSRCPRIPVVLMEERIFASPIDDFFRLAGTMEFSGFNLVPRPKRVEMLSIGAGRYFPEVPQLPVRSQWCHLRPMTPDGLPVIGPVPRTTNVWVGTGHGMLGFTQGPITGKLLAACVLGDEPCVDLAAVRPDRF